MHKAAAWVDWTLPDRQDSNNSDLPLTVKISDYEADQTPFATQHLIFKPYNACVLVMKIDLEEKCTKWWGSLSHPEAWALSIGKHIEHSIPVLVVFSLWNYRKDKLGEFEQKMAEVWKELRHQDSVRVDKALEDKSRCRSGTVSKIDFKEYVGVACDPDSPDNAFNIASVQSKIAELARSVVASHPTPEKLPRILAIKEEFLHQDKPVVHVNELLEKLDDDNNHGTRSFWTFFSYLWKRKKKQGRKQTASQRAASMDKATLSALEAANSMGEVMFDEAFMPDIVILDPVLFVEMWEAILGENELDLQQETRGEQQVVPAPDTKYVRSMIRKHEPSYELLHLEGIVKKSMLPHILNFKESALGEFCASTLRSSFFEALKKTGILLPLENELSRGGGRRSVGESEERFFFPERFTAGQANREPGSGQHTEEYDIVGKLVVAKRVALTTIVPPSFFAKLLPRILSLIQKRPKEKVDLTHNLVLEERHMEYKFEGWPKKECSMWLLVNLNEIDAVSLTIAANHPRKCSKDDAIVGEMKEFFEQVCYSLELILAQHDCYVARQQLGGGVDCSSKGEGECFSGVKMVWIKEEDLQRIKDSQDQACDHDLSEAQLECLTHLLEDNSRLYDIRQSKFPNFDKKKRDYKRTPELPECIVYIPPGESEESRKKIEEMLEKLCQDSVNNNADRISGPASAPLFQVCKTENLPQEAKYYKIYCCHPVRNLYISLDEFDEELLVEEIDLFRKLYACRIEVTIAGATEEVDAVSAGLGLAEQGARCKVGIFNSRKRYRKMEKEFEVSPKAPGDGLEEVEFPLTELDVSTLTRDGGSMRALAKSRLFQGESHSFDRLEIEWAVKKKKDIKAAVEVMKVGVKAKYRRVRNRTLTMKFKVYYRAWNGHSWTKPDMNKKSSKKDKRKGKDKGSDNRSESED